MLIGKRLLLISPDYLVATKRKIKFKRVKNDKAQQRVAKLQMLSLSETPYLKGRTSEIYHKKQPISKGN